MAAKTNETKRAIIAVIDRLGSATPKEIATMLGGDWACTSKRVPLQKLLARMVSSRLLRNPSYGRYVVVADRVAEGLDVRDFTTTAIVSFLRQRGGVARTREIMEAVADRPRGGSERGYEHKRVTTALAECPRFRQDFGRGWWNLPQGELDELPFVGATAKHRVDEVVGGYERFFASVGDAFMETRDHVRLSEVVANPKIREALHGMGFKAPAERSKALEAFRVEVERATSEPDRARWAIADALSEQMAEGLAAQLYISFESGNIDLHLAAPVELYVECARLFGVSPAALSRGRIAKPKPNPLNQLMITKMVQS